MQYEKQLGCHTTTWSELKYYWSCHSSIFLFRTRSRDYIFFFTLPWNQIASTNTLYWELDLLFSFNPTLSKWKALNLHMTMVFNIGFHVHVQPLNNEVFKEKTCQSLYPKVARVSTNIHCDSYSSGKDFDKGLDKKKALDELWTVDWQWHWQQKLCKHEIYRKTFVNLLVINKIISCKITQNLILFSL